MVVGAGVSNLYVNRELMLDCKSIIIFSIYNKCAKLLNAKVYTNSFCDLLGA